MLHTIRIISLLFFVSLATVSSAQKLTTKSKKAESLYNKALAYYGNDKYELAKEPLNQAMKKDPDFIEAYILLSEVFFEQGNYHKQASILENVIVMDSTFYVFSYYSLGVANFHMDKFDDAKRWFEKYYYKTRSKQSKQKVVQWLEKTMFAKEAKENPVEIKAVNLGNKINTKNNEYWPSITADNQTLVYTVMVPRDSFVAKTPFQPSLANYYHEDFYKAVKDNSGEWSSGQALLPPINSDSNEGAQSLSADGNWMFFTACGRRDTKGSCDIYFSYRTRYGWSEPKNVGAPVNTPYFESQPSFSSDGRTLYYTTNRAGGKGRNDIWRAKIMGLRSDGTPFFSMPENLGDSINTTFDEVSPFIHHDNNTLYFSSNGWSGMGQMDVFLSHMHEDEGFGKSVNLGYPINSSGDDIGLVVTSNGETAYFSSERFGESFGGKDLYSFTMPPKVKPLPVSYIKGRVFDQLTKEKLKAALELKDLESRKMIVQALSTDFSGEFLICLPLGGSYALNVSKEGYLFYSDHFDMEKQTSAIDPMVMDIYLKKIKIGEQIVLNNVFFETDSYILKSLSEVELNKIVSFLTLNSHVKVEILGYTDNVGSQDYNLELSRKRAQQVYQYLIDSGIHSNRLSFSGKGMSNPIESNETEKGRAKNRRTEMKIIEQ